MNLNLTNLRFDNKATGIRRSSTADLRPRRLLIYLIISNLLLLGACSDSSSYIPAEEPDIGETSGEENSPVDGPFADLSDDTLIPPKQPYLGVTGIQGSLVFTWSDHPAGSQVNLLSYSITDREFNTLYTRSTELEAIYQMSVDAHLFDWQNARFVLEVCAEKDCVKSDLVSTEHLRSAVLTELTVEDSASYDLLGNSVAITQNGSVLFAGAPGTDNGELGDAGAVHSWFRIGSYWWHENVIETNLPGAGSQFGFSLATDDSGNTLVVGAPKSDYFGNLAGSVSVFERLGEGMIERDVLVPESSLEEFGYSVSLSSDGKSLFIGAPGAFRGNDRDDPDTEPTPSGQVYFYTLSANEWILQQIIHPDQAIPFARFGHALASGNNGQLLVISSAMSASPKSSSDPVNTNGSISVWAREQNRFLKLTTLTSGLGDGYEFGRSVTIDQTGNHIVASVTSRQDTSGVAIELEKPVSQAAVFSSIETGQWQQTQLLVPSGTHETNAELDLAITDDGAIIVIGLSGPSGQLGTLSTFVQNPDSPLDATASTASWHLYNEFEDPELMTPAKNQIEPRLAVTDRDPNAPASGFGGAVAISGDGSTLVVSAPEKNREIDSPDSDYKSGGVYVSGSGLRVDRQ